MREREVEKILVDGIRKLGGRAFKWVSPGNDGVPDSGISGGVRGAENNNRETDIPTKGAAEKIKRYGAGGKSAARRTRGEAVPGRV